MIVVYSASSQHTANLSFVIFLSFFFFFFCMSPDRSRQVLISTLAGCQINAPVKTLGARISPFYEQSSVVLYFYFVLFRVLTCSGEWWGLRESRIAWVCTVHHVLSEICAGSLFDHISRTGEKKKKKKSTEPSGTFGVVEFTTVCWDDRRSGSRFDEIN